MGIGLKFRHGRMEPRRVQRVDRGWGWRPFRRFLPEQRSVPRHSDPRGHRPLKAFRGNGFIYLAEAIEAQFGPRCPRFAEGCATCEAWKAHDDLHDGFKAGAEAMRQAIANELDSLSAHAEADIVRALPLPVPDPKR